MVRFLPDPVRSRGATPPQERTPGRCTMPSTAGETHGRTDPRRADSRARPYARRIDCAAPESLRAAPPMPERGGSVREPRERRSGRGRPDA